MIKTIYTVIGLVFGVILAAGHLLSWNIEFTNDHGQALWRGCGLCVLASVIVFPCASVGVGICDGKANFWPTLGLVAAVVMCIVGAIAYVTARLILIYLTIHSFSNLPAGVYDDIDWLQYIPFFH